MPRILRHCLICLLFLVPVGIARNVSASNPWISTRIGGPDRYSTAVEISIAYFKTSVHTVVLATGVNFADSLSGSALAAKLGSPMLLTPRDELPQVVRQEISRLKPSRAVVLGGKSALSAEIESQLTSLGISNIVRLAGADRYETSAKISQFGWPNPDDISSRVAFLASGEEYGPGLIGGAAAGRIGSPLLLTRVDEFPYTIESEIKRLNIDEIRQVGYGAGTGRVGWYTGLDFLNETGVSRTHFHQEDLPKLSAMVAEYTPSRGLKAPEVLLVSSENFPDALAAGAVAAARSLPLLMTPKSCLSKAIFDQLSLYQTSRLVVVGLSAAISDSVTSGEICASQATTTTTSPRTTTTTTRPPVATSPPTTPTPSINSSQGILYTTFGCRNQIRIRAIDNLGKSVGERVVVQSTQNVQLIVYGISPDDSEIIFGSYDCDTHTRSLYRQALVSNPVASRILLMPSNWDIIGATWDIARNVPVVLLRDSNWNYTVQVLSGGNWKSLGYFSRADFGNYYPMGIQSRTGYEFLLWSNSLSNWSTWRMSRNGDLTQMMFGSGNVDFVTSTPLMQMDAFLGSNGSWICNGSSVGWISGLVSQKKCSFEPDIKARYGAFSYSDQSNSFWLHLSPSNFEAPYMKRIDCLGSSLFDCGTPISRETKKSDLQGLRFQFLTLFGISDFGSLNSSRVP